ncbi:MAG: PAS domain S-box protein [Anaerolineae bacterium]
MSDEAEPGVTEKQDVASEVKSSQGAADVGLSPVSSPRAPSIGEAEEPWTREEWQRFTVLLRIASEISARVNAILDPDELLNNVIPLLKEGFDLYYVHVYVLDLPRRQLLLRAGYGDPGRRMLARGHKIPLDAEQSLVARAARTKAPVVVNDVTQTPDFLPNPLLPDTKSELALPMVVGDEVLGVFDIQHDETDVFSPVYLDVFVSLAGQIAIALQNARFVERIEETLVETRTGFEIGQALAEAQTEEAVLDALVNQAGQIDEALTMLALFDPDADEPTLVIRQLATFDSAIALPELGVGSRVPAADFPYYRSGTHRGILAQSRDEEGLDDELREAMTAADVESLFVVPFERGGTPLGVLIAMAKAPGYFTSECRMRYRALAEQGATALAQARLRDQLSLTQFSVDQAPTAILWIRPDSTIHSANERACELFGYTRSELLDLPSFSKLDPNMIPDVWAVHWRKVKQDKRFTIETEYRTKRGNLIPLEVTANYLRYEDEEFNCIFARDITERKQAELMRERFTVQLRTAAEIAEQVGAILDPDELLAAVIPLLKERFELYHAHVYAVEDKALVLRAGYGRIGQIMVQQGHKIPLNHTRSLVARAARTGEPAVVNDVTSAPDFLPNMLLPRTKSEVAVPIVIGDDLLGVFDVQSDQLDAFTASDVDVFRTLSGQLANALYSATLFEQQAETQSELRNSVETVRAIFNAMTEGIMLTDMMGRIVDVNEAALRLYGYDDHEDLVGRSAMELVTQTGWSRMAETMRQALETGQGEVLEYKMLRKDGSTFDAERSSALLWDSEGELQGMVSITRDVTESKRARREIARFHALAENAVDSIVMTDLSGYISYANPAAYRLFGYDPATREMLGMRVSDLWPESEVHVLLESALPAAGEAGWQGEAAQVRMDGSRFDAALTFFSVKGASGEPISVATIIRDVTERKEAQAEMRRFAMQLRTAAEVAADINRILDPTELLEVVVPLVQERFRLYHLHVYTLDAERGQLVMRVGSGEAGRVMHERGHEIALDRRQSLVAKAARSRETVLVDDVRQEADFLPNPLLPDTRTEVAVPMLAGDEVIGVFDVQDDRPGRFSQSEVDVFTTLAAQIGIAFRNAEYFEELQAVADRLRELDRLKSEFLANMSHELRTPLNSILGYAEVILMGIDGELTAEMQEDVEAIFENGHQLLQLINDILDLTKIEAGRMELSRMPVDVLPVLEETRSNNYGLIHKQQKPVEITVSAPEDLPRINADPVRLGQIMNNLVSNAVKFTEEGHVYLRAHLRQEDDVVCIEVEDTGVGIDEGDLEGLFQRFHQVDGSSTRRAEGTGLGLAITKHLVEMHDGELMVESELGKGSTFTICLPIFPDE